MCDLCICNAPLYYFSEFPLIDVGYQMSSTFRSFVQSDMISQRSGGSRSGGQLGTGRGTLRLRSKGPATVEELVSSLNSLAHSQDCASVEVDVTVFTK